jgi:RHS repeat-associated protein
MYGPVGLLVEQINNGTEKATYLHHDQQGSTRLLTGSTGAVEGKCSYGAYGAATCEGMATTPLGWDARYTSVDTGLIYLRARVYEPATAQFMSVDPAGPITQAPYIYANDNLSTSATRAGCRCLALWKASAKECSTRGWGCPERSRSHICR